MKGFVQALLNRWDKLSDDQKQADADHRQRRRRPAGRPDRRAPRRRPDRHRPARSSTRAAVDAEVLVGRVVASVEAGTAAAASRSTSRTDLPEIFVDPDKFTQVVTNLVENADPARRGPSGPRPPRGAADACPASASPSTTRATGIPVELRRRVFTKFWTTGESRRVAGWACTSSTAWSRAHGGRVTIEDAPGGGARVMVDWPQRRPAAGLTAADLHTTFTSRPRLLPASRS